MRDAVSLKRRSLPELTVSESSKKICNEFIASEYFKDSENIALYFPFNNEVDPLEIFEFSLKTGKKVYLPRIDDNVLRFHRVTSLKGLVVNGYGINEPEAGGEFTRAENIDIFVLPGLAFDTLGNRIGYGKGYYDRTLKTVPTNRIFGFCYNFQIFNLLPVNRLDKKVGYLVSEDGVFSCKS